jgi:hypothetical protein
MKTIFCILSILGNWQNDAFAKTDSQPVTRQAPVITAPLTLTDREKESYILATETKLAEWDRIISRLRTNAKNAAAMGRRERLENTANYIEEKYQETKDRLNDLKLEPSESWRVQQLFIETRFDDMRRRYHTILAE